MISRRAVLHSTLVLSLAAAGATAAPAALFTPYDEASFGKALKSGKFVLVHVHADWCSTCQAQKSALNELLTEPRFKDVVPIVVNYDTDTAFKTTYKTPNRSTILVFKDGKEISRTGGVTSKDDIKAALITAMEKAA
jgi:thiol-disulfide isomerase/thioredoxin